MDEMNAEVVTQASSPEESPSPAVNAQPDLQARRAERRQQWLAGALGSPDPKTAVIGSTVLELLEFTPVLQAAMTDVAAAVNNPVERLAKLVQGLQMCSNLCRLADKLA